MSADPSLWANDLPQDLDQYDEQTQATIQRLIQEDESVRAGYFAADTPKDPPAQLIGASGFSQGINMAIPLATGPI